jgi:uncharacterized protein YkwD
LRTFPRIAATALALVAILLVAASPASARRSATSVETEVLQRINDQRTALGRKALIADPRLAPIAGSHSLRMARTGSLVHAPFLRILRAVNGHRAGEVIAAGMTPADVVTAWFASSVHRPILLDRGFRLAGVGVATGTVDGVAVWYVTVDVAV